MPLPDPRQTRNSTEPLKLEELGSSPELQQLFERYPGLRAKLREIYRTTLEEEWSSDYRVGGHGRAPWTAEKGFKRGLGQVTKWRESCEDGSSTGAEAEGFMKFIALVTGSQEESPL